ncbi:hypothetical protein LHK_02474 [Laribacter hongkongensis HLHK9]|uniref:Uncharacterized protein n=1 Tax=Laribacter hongkongensis (strain HLHK9) TaxID=557598 RepID=C1DBQ3_LARHH|nr:hypothetical protein LHK_02474 [Laribacter hongkongensis HLHK9]
MSWVASLAGYRGDDFRNILLEAVEQRFGLANPPVPIG